MEESRVIWAAARAVQESNRFKSKRSGKKSRSHWTLFQNLLDHFVILLKLFGFHEKGLQNAQSLMVNELELSFENLPSSFNNYKILHLSDLHLDTLPGIEDIIAEKIRNVNYDVCILTGDYRKDTHGRFRQVLPQLKTIVRSVRAQDGIIAILGNHDTYMIAPHLENMGMRLLINESTELVREDERIVITGTDDPYYYYTDKAVDALEEIDEDFKIALVHTTELHDVASDNNYALYLCGHTHGGQICLPGGKPLITHQFEGRHFFRGQWEHNGMIGYTNVGCGVSAIPIRYNCPGEIALITLKRG